MCGGLRNKEDGLTFFGFKNNEKVEIINDYLLNNDEIKIQKDEKHIELNEEMKINDKINTLFLIYFRRDNAKYYFKLLDKNTFCFVNLMSPYVMILLYI